jgi:hypothetical protein
VEPAIARTVFSPGAPQGPTNSIGNRESRFAWPQRAGEFRDALAARNVEDSGG